MDLDFDVSVMLEDVAAGVNLDALWRPDELEALVAAASVPDVAFKEYDESVADDVQYCECPKCGHKFPK